MDPFKYFFYNCLRLIPNCLKKKNCGKKNSICYLLLIQFENRLAKKKKKKAFINLYKIQDFKLKSKHNNDHS